MAFKSISSAAQTDGDALKTTNLEIGESYIGYPIERRLKEDDPRKANVVFKMENGETKLIFTSGNFAYACAEEKLKLNVLTKVTRIADGVAQNKKTGKSMKTTKFEIQQDEEQTLELAEFNAIGDAPANAPAVPVSTPSNPKTRAEALAKSVAASKRA